MCNVILFCVLSKSEITWNSLELDLFGIKSQRYTLQEVWKKLLETVDVFCGMCLRCRSESVPVRSVHLMI